MTLESKDNIYLSIDRKKIKLINKALITYFFIKGMYFALYIKQFTNKRI